jgi:hypothetical protein
MKEKFITIKNDVENLLDCTSSDGGPIKLGG